MKTLITATIIASGISAIAILTGKITAAIAVWYLAYAINPFNAFVASIYIFTGNATEGAAALAMAFAMAALSVAIVALYPLFTAKLAKS